MNDLDAYIVAPIYYRVVRRCGTQWHFVLGECFYNPLNLPSMSLDDLFSSFGITMREAASQLRKINGGKEGFYLVDIMHKHRTYALYKSTIICITKFRRLTRSWAAATECD